MPTVYGPGTIIPELKGEVKGGLAISIDSPSEIVVSGHYAALWVRHMLIGCPQSLAY
jgi:hypothetical protein